MTAYTWDGTKFVNEAGKPVFARYDKYSGCYVYEEDTPMAAHAINAPLVERYQELAHDADEKRRLENAASPSMQYLLIENNRVCAERDAALKELEVERAANLTFRSWMAENNDYARGFLDGRAAERQDALDFPEQPVTEPTEQHAPLLRAIRQKP